MKSFLRDYSLRKNEDLNGKKALASQIGKHFKMLKDLFADIASDISKAKSSGDFDVSHEKKEMKRCEDEADEARIDFLIVRVEDIDDRKDTHVKRDTKMKKAFLKELVAVFNELKTMTKTELAEEKDPEKKKKFKTILSDCEKLKRKWQSNAK